MSSKFLNLEGLKESIGSQNPIKAKEIVENICSFFDEDLSTAELAHAIEILFHNESGTLAFVNKTLKERKLFSDSTAIIFELWAKLFQNYAKEISFESYAENIIQVCSKYIVSTVVSAKEKERAAIALQEMFQNGLVQDIDISALVILILEIFKIKSKQATFLQEIYKLLGAISKDSPDSITKVIDPNHVRDVFLNPLETTLLNEQTLQFNTLTGALDGLNLFLMNFAPSPQEDSEICQRIYVCMKRLSDPFGSSKKATFRASLDLFTAHTCLFSAFIFKDFKYWHDLLNKWLASSVYEDRRKGMFAVHAFHQIISTEIMERKDDASRSILQSITNSFRETLESPTARSFESRIAIRGFGIMSGPCKHMSPDVLDKIVLLVIQRTELISMAEDNELRNSLEHFPHYTEALSQIITVTEDKQARQMLTQNIENITIRLIRDFHYLSQVHTQLVVNSLARAFFNLTKVDGTLLDNVLEKVILNGVIWTCSHKLVYDASLDWSTEIDWKDNITYKSYIPLWKGLIVDAESFTFNRPLVAKKVFDNLMKTLLFIIEKLDLRTKRRVYTDEDGTDKEFFFCDPNIDLCPVKPQDFHIYFNIVDFFKDIFWVKFRYDNFKPWIQEYCLKMIQLALRHPLISGFLKLLEVGLVKADFLQFFDDTLAVEVHILYQQLSHFLKHLIAKCQKVSGELQVSCLEVILKYPCRFYKEFIIALVPIFEIAFDLGKSMIWLAKLALCTLEKMLDMYSEHSQGMEKLFRKVLPYLDAYLRCKSIDINTSSEIVKVRHKRRIRKVAITKVTETDLNSLQKQIVMFLGKVSPQMATLMISGERTDSLVKWEIDQSLRVILHMSTMRPTIYLDTMMPRICELALTSGDRRTKIAACELVHAVILYFMGIRRYKGQIWKELCNCMLILASDNDVTVQQMYEPLLKQTMHFMAKSENLEGAEPLMEALMRGISNSANCSIRDLSAVCLREFVEWSLKLMTPEQFAVSPGSIGVILGNLKMASFDSDRSKRNGAALAFNNLYRILREQERICNIYFIDLLYTFCVNFKLSEELSSVPLSEALNSDLEQVSMSLEHVVRVLKERSDLFIKINSDRILPSTGKIFTLKDICIFLLKESGSKLLKYRSKCMEFFKVLVTRLPGITSLSVFIENNVTLSTLQVICEGSSDGTGIRARPNLNFIQREGIKPHSALYSWLQHFLASLDFYCWLLGENATKQPDQLLNDGNIFNVISYYLEEICLSDINEVIRSIDETISVHSSDTVALMTAEDVCKIQAIKVLIAMRILDFLTKTHMTDSAQKFVEISSHEAMRKIYIRFVRQIIYEPQEFGFDFTTKEFAIKLSQRIQKFISIIGRYCLDEVFVRELQADILLTLENQLRSIAERIEEVMHYDAVTENQENLLSGIFFVCKNLSALDVNDTFRNFLKNLSMELFSDLFLKIKNVVLGKEYALNPPSVVNRFVNQLMAICFVVNNMAPNVVHCLLDTTILFRSDARSKITHGEHFFAIYKNTLIEYCDVSFIENVIVQLLENINALNFHQILKFFIEFVDSLLHKSKNSNCLETLVDVILSNIAKILQHVNRNKEELMFIRLISNLMHANFHQVHKFCSKAEGLESWILDRLKNENSSLEIKSRIIFLLPTIVGPDDETHKELTNVLEDLQRQYFPLRSNEFAKNSLEETALKFMFKSLLTALTISRSYVILEFIVKCTATDSKHVIEWMIRDEVKSYMVLLSSEQQSLQLNRILEISSNQSLEPNIRLTIVERFLLTMIRSAEEESLVDFYVKNIKRIKEMTDVIYGLANSGWTVEHALITRIIGFELIEVMCACLPRSRSTGVDSPIVRQFCAEPTTGSEVIGAFTKSAYHSRKEVFVTDDIRCRELFRVYQCAAYRAVCSLVSNTQDELKFYVNFIFLEHPNNNQLIWQKLIDCSKDDLYVFEGQESEEYLKIKERFVAIRKLNSRPNIANRLLTTMTSKLLQTQSIFQSSLSQDVAKLDLNYSAVRTSSEALQRREKFPVVTASVRLERNILNKHEVMPILCGVVQHVFENDIVPIPSRNDQQRPYPWINAIVGAMENPSSHRNIRIFLAQMVENCREVFQHFGYALFRPVLQILIDECACGHLNFFITDLVAMLLSWTSKKFYQPTTAEDRRLVSLLLKCLMQNAWHEKNQIFKFNLELIQSVISVWKDVISAPAQFLLDSITKTRTPSSRDNGSGLILLGLVLNSGLDVWSESSKDIFIRGVVANLSNEHPIIYQSAAGVFGIILFRLQSAGDQDEIDKRLPDIVHQIKSWRTKNEKKFLDVVYGIHKHYPEIVDSFREIITFKIPLAPSAIKCSYMEMFLSRVDSYKDEDIYKVLISIGITNILKNAEYQLLGLHIVNRAVRKMSEEDVTNILPMIEFCLDSKKTDCREIAYEILIYISTAGFGDNLANRAGQFLLNGLSDSDPKIQDRIFHFWSKEGNLPAKVDERILFLISDYSLKCEKNFLAFSTQLLLELAIENSDSKNQVFEYQTDEEDKLTEYDVNTNSRTKYTNSLPPLFAESHNTRRSMLLGSQSCNYVQTNDEYHFEPTLDRTKDFTISQSFTLPTPSGIPFIMQPQILDRRSQKIRSQEGSADPNIDSSFDKLRKRFLKDKENETRRRALQVIDHRARQKHLKEYEQKSSQSRVTLYRRYRNGDYPDLLITHLALLLPLQALVKRDELIARDVFVSIFARVAEALGPEINMFITSASNKIQMILESAKICNPMIFATFMETALFRPEKFDFPPDLIAMFSKASNMQTIGAIYLENRINADWETDAISSKTTSTTAIDEQHWLHLSDIYHSLAEDDIVSSIFADKMRTDPRLAEAIELKANGRYEDAQNLLMTVIDRRVQIEHYYAYICYYECFLEMGMWSELSVTVQSQVDDFEELWSDDYNMAFLLPNLMQAELQLILQNKSESQNFLRVLESWTSDPVKSEHIKRNFCEELMMLHLANRDFLQARVYAECYLKTFVVDWSVVSSLSYKLRQRNLLNAQKVAEINQYALLLIENFSENSAAILKYRWERCTVRDSDSLRFWNCIIAYRTYIGHLTRDMLANLDSEACYTDLEEVICHMNLQLFNAAIRRENHVLSKKLLDQLQLNSSFCRKYDTHCGVAKVKQIVIESQQQTDVRRVHCLKDAWTMNEKVLQNEKLKVETNLQLEALDLHTEIGEKLLESLTPEIFNGELKAELTRISGVGASQVKEYFFNQSLQSLKTAAGISKVIVNRTDLKTDIAKTFYRLAQFCYDHHERGEIEMDKMIIEYVFLAMKHDSKEARLLFPSMLQLRSVENGNLCDHFNTHSSDVPEWMFISWLPQILSRFDLNRSCHLDNIVKRIATSYPNALAYPFNVWYERHASERPNVNRAEIEEIIAKLKNPLIEKFIQNFQILCLPEYLLKVHLEEFIRAIHPSTALDQEKFLAKLWQLIYSVFIKNNSLQGPAYNKIFAHKESLEEIQKLNIENDSQKIHTVLRNIVELTRKAIDKYDTCIQLETVCPWFFRFQWCGEEKYLELPGQYDGDCRPNISNHVKIVKFGQKIEVFKSLRRPFRITIFGSNAKSFDFLVKYGEDLKQDQRIQQMLRLMSEKLSEDQHCRNQNLFIRTYQVIPIGQKCGMFSWVSDTMALQSFIMKSFLRSKPDGNRIMIETRDTYVQFIQNASGEEPLTSNLNIYGKAVLRYTRNQIIANFRNLENAVTLEVLKQALVEMSVSPESFFVLRNNYATSLAAMNISNWILGIGDRHGLNILISTKDARLIGIDFGCNFGSGVRDLAVPELIPFRLTPHMVATMQPLGTSGLIFKCMVHALRVFRQSKRVLMACMEVFVREPTVNWLNPVRMENISSSSDTDWQPSDRIDVTQQKLLGSNPMHLLERELKSGIMAQHPEYLQAYVDLLRGNSQFNIRARLPETNLTVEQQVKCLIDTATDSAILGVAYDGFFSWL